MFSNILYIDENNTLYVNHVIKKGFESSFDIFTKDSTDTKDFLQKRWEPNYCHGYIENRNQEERNILYDIYIRSLLYGVPVEIKEGKLYTSILFTIIDMIHGAIEYHSPKDSIDVISFTKLLMGGFKDKFYTIGGNGLKLLQELLQFHNKKSTDDIERIFTIQNTLDDLIGLHSEILSEDMIDAFKTIDLLYQDKENINIEEVYEHIQKTGIGSAMQMRFSNIGIDNLDNSILEEDIITGFKEIIFEREPIYNPYFLIDAIVTSIYNKMDIFLIFDTYNNTMGLYNADQISVGLNNISSIINLSALVRFLFQNSSLSTEIENIEVFDSTNIKSLFDEVYKQLLLLKPNDITLHIEGKVYDTKRFNEISQNINYGNIGFNNHGGKKQSIAFSLEKQLKKYMKTVK